MVRWCLVNFQCRGVLLIWIIVGQGPTTLAVGASGGCLDIFSLVCRFSFLSPSLRETARYRLKYCLKGPLSPKQPTNQPLSKFCSKNQLLQLCTALTVCLILVTLGLYTVMPVVCRWLTNEKQRKTDICLINQLVDDSSNG